LPPICCSLINRSPDGDDLLLVGNSHRQVSHKAFEQRVAT
jgi:hypothetical protein